MPHFDHFPRPGESDPYASQHVVMVDKYVDSQGSAQGQGRGHQGGGKDGAGVTCSVAADHIGDSIGCYIPKFAGRNFYFDIGQTSLRRQWPAGQH